MKETVKEIYLLKELKNREVMGLEPNHTASQRQSQDFLCTKASVCASFGEPVLTPAACYSQLGRFDFPCPGPDN